ncbi:RiPP maturation radical SAM protein 1 [Roseomonas eburnea]|uniref:RiPP maturation radical SAM protein 1 n=1 Tax=Neoroseomonas eburnea TaxID=1346889 RepID=A0A9X9XFZ9_9PROT|nr:RiPP maturation radical SAM C-methyltransferase [Neoroseomonas eburnea]MBR0682635.1 RiPP maturation radical SAM protein 1 [Neoroseomonas eburnea]
MPRPGADHTPHAAGRGGVLLASLPLASARYPSLALGLLKSGIAARGIPCDVRYFSLDYVASVGSETFSCLTDTAYHTSMVGEWVFARAARMPSAADEAADLGFLTHVFRAVCPEREYVARLLLILAAREGAEAFIEHCAASIDWDRYAVLGLSTAFQQNMATLAFARRVKERAPHVLIVLGGPNCQGEMGVELHRRYPFIDVVCLGEGDRTFPELVCRHLAREDLAGLPGMVIRSAEGQTSLPRIDADRISDLDTLPYPDLDDFYAQRAATAAEPHAVPAVIFEAARGCWWGAKHHCTFCGLNGRSMAYRSKSQRRAYDELAHLVARHGGDVVTTDAILDLRYFEEFLPLLASQGPDASIYWQMKANLRPDQMELLAQAGVRRIQPGIEALDTELLTLMRKGCTMLQNVQTLKMAAEFGISVAWNLLYGFPGESEAAYARTARLIPLLRHLQPPNDTGRALADRFSPYFERPAAFGVTLRPCAGYRYIYPFGDEGVGRLAYHFDMHSDALDRIESVVAPMKTEQTSWNLHHAESALHACDENGVLVVHDERWGWPRQTTTLVGCEAAVARLCWRITPEHEIRARLAGEFGAAQVRNAMATLLQRGFLVEEDGAALALFLTGPGRRRALNRARLARGGTMPGTGTACSSGATEVSEFGSDLTR